MEQRHDAPDQEQVGWNPPRCVDSAASSRICDDYPGPDGKNHTGEDRTAEGTTTRTAEVVVHDSSVCAGSMRNVECRMDLRTVYPTD
jgi:hypothetical protein